MLLQLPLTNTACAVMFFVSLALTFGAFLLFSRFLPEDRGRALAFDGEKSRGKRTSAGLLFVSCFALLSLAVFKMPARFRVYLAAVLVEMAMGYFDDHAKKPWGELKKGLTDLAAPLLIAFAFIALDGGAVRLAVLSGGSVLPIAKPVLAVLVVILVWGSINVTNITDGVDGLSATLATVTLASVLIAARLLGTMADFRPVVLVFMGALLCYLWFNLVRHTHLMGDAGSRAMGVMISLAMLEMGAPFLYLPFALVFALDGASSMLKLTVLRVLKIKGFMKNIRTPLHDHVRKVLNWSDRQTVARFALIQAAVSMLTLLLM